MEKNINRLLPNTFQLPNIVIDKYERYLTPEEFKVLVWIYRHINGWQDKINIRCRNISVSTFLHGIGEQHGPCGLGRGAILASINKLTEYHLILKDGNAGKDGQLYRLQDDEHEVDFNGLKRRLNSKKKSNILKTLSATKYKTSKSTGTSDEPVDFTGTSDIPVRQTNQKRFVTRTATGTSDVHIQTQVQTQVQTQPPPAANAAEEGEELNPPPEPQASEINGNENSSGTNGNGSSDHDKPKKSTTEERRKLLVWWNGLGIVTHRNEPKSGKTTLQSALDSILRTGETLRDICLTIENYRDVLNSPQTRFSYKWGLTDFLVRGYSKFTDRDAAFHNFVNARLNDNGRNGGEPRDRTLEVYESAMRAAKIADSMVVNNA